MEEKTKLKWYIGAGFAFIAAGTLYLLSGSTTALAYLDIIAGAGIVAYGFMKLKKL